MTAGFAASANGIVTRNTARADWRPVRPVAVDDAVRAGAAPGRGTRIPAALTHRGALRGVLVSTRDWVRCVDTRPVLGSWRASHARSAGRPERNTCTVTFTSDFADSAQTSRVFFMSEPRVSRVHRLLVLASVFVGLFIMHGLQATPSPVQASGAVVTSMAAAHTTPVHHCMVDGMTSGAVNTWWMPSHGSGDHPDHAHPGGAVCFALLVLGGLILLLFGSRSRLCVTRSLVRTVLLIRRGPPRARPPNVYQLSVLRL